MKAKKMFYLSVLISLIFLNTAKAQDKPIQLALFNPVQIFDENTSITGLRINLIYGKNAQVSGLDWGLINHITSGVSKGVQFGLVGIVEADYMGWQDNGVNITKGKFEGLQWGIVNYAGTVSGVQIGLVNYAANMTKGLQIGLVNIIKQGGQFPFFPIVNWAL
ncbi:MAG: hypothetical protein KJ571_04525 [Bacteroidetes bacterium]|nr:hypothetical protein [Bacteroidota bacterium]